MSGRFMQVIETPALRKGMRPGVRAGIVAIATLALLCDPSGAFAQNAPATGLVVSGTVYDSIARRRIPRVSVQLVNADNPAARPFAAEADSSGRFSISGVPPGRYFAGFFHPALDTLGLDVPPRLVEVGAAGDRVDLATPSPRTIIQTVCPAATPDSAGLFMGSIRGTDTETPIAGATVIVEWSEFVLDVARVYERPRTVTGRTSEAGWFAFCGLPTDAVLLVRAASGADSSGYTEVEVPARGLRHQRFTVGGASSVTIADSAPAIPGSGRPPSKTVLRGSARLLGTVTDTSGRPVANAHVLVWGTSADVRTNDRGAFALDGLPGGTHTLEVRVIGYVPVTRVVQLAAARPATVELRLEKAAVILATETVRGTVVYSRQLQEFDRRRRTGMGRYLTKEHMSQRPNARLSQLLQGTLGVEVRQQGSRSEVLMRSSGSGYCTPTLYVDGSRDLSGDFDYLYTDEIAGVEVYPRESQRPAGYTDGSGCGAVVVWTQPRSTRTRR